jgi:TolB-like protein
VEQRFCFGPFELDGSRGVLTRDGSPVALGHRALVVLQALVSAEGRVVTKADLMARAWPNLVVEEANLTVQIAAIRKMLSEWPEARDWISTAARVGYRFVGPVRPQQAQSSHAEAAGKPSIAVLPFANQSGDSTQDYFVDGITEDLIHALSRFRWFFVIGRNSSFAFKGKAVGIREVARELGVRYVLEGTVRRAGERIRVAAELNDAPGARQIWAQRYDFALGDMFSIQDQIVQQVAGAMEPELLKSEGRFASLRRGSLSAWDLVRQGTHLFHKVGRETHLRARELFREAVRREADLPDPCIWLARVSAGIVAYGWSGDRSADLREGIAAAQQAILRDEQSPYSHYALAIVSAYAGDPAQSQRSAERALELNPSFALGYLVLGLALLFAGRAADAAGPLERGLKLNPHDPQNFVWYNLLAFAHYFAGSPDRALAAAERAWDIRPGWRPTRQLACCCHLAQGHTEAAAQCAAEFRRLSLPTDELLEPLKRNADLWTGIETALRRAGYADEPAR